MDISNDPTGTVAPVPANEKIKVYVWTDFVCPYCLIGEGHIKEAVAAENAEMIWMPFELRPYPGATLRPEEDYLQTSWKTGVYPTAKRLGVSITLPTVSPQPYSRLAFIGMQWAVDQGRGADYVELVLRAFFQQDRDIGDVEVLKDIVAGMGLDASAFAEALKDPDLARRHDDALRLAHEIGVQSVPSILIGNRLIAGFRDAATLRDIIASTQTNLLDYPGVNHG